MIGWTIELEVAMAYTIRRADYFYLPIAGKSGAPSELLSALAERGVNLLAFAAVPMGPNRTQLTLFPEDNGRFTAEASRAGLTADGPHPALLVQGDDELGALARVNQTLTDAGIEVFAATGVADGRGSFGYVVYVRPGDVDRAVKLLASA
jgi:hypothetical protein